MEELPVSLSLGEMELELPSGKRMKNEVKQGRLQETEYV